ncbi:MAG: hypothetical protein ABIT83_11185 [Massilia sp.]
MPFLSDFANKKTYAFHRMTVALGRAIASSLAGEKDRAARWANAWGLMAGVRGRRVRLRTCEVTGIDPTERRKTVRA